MVILESFLSPVAVVHIYFYNLLYTTTSVPTYGGDNILINNIKLFDCFIH